MCSCPGSPAFSPPRACARCRSLTAGRSWSRIWPSPPRACASLAFAYREMGEKEALTLCGRAGLHLHRPDRHDGSRPRPESRNAVLNAKKGGHQTGDDHRGPQGDGPPPSPERSASWTRDGLGGGRAGAGSRWTTGELADKLERDLRVRQSFPRSTRSASWRPGRTRAALWP